MKQPLAFLIGCILLMPFIPVVQAQSSVPKNPFSREIDEGRTADSRPSSSSADQATNDLLYNLSGLDTEADKLEASFGFVDDKGDYTAGSLGRLKLKPSDKKRLIQLANGSLSEEEKKTVMYDQRLLQLLVQLTTPEELGGGGIQYLRVGDLLRFRNDPRSHETEGTDNISQHQFGKAADIIEINKTHCTEKSFFGSQDLPPFPVKVAWQGGAPFNPAAQAPVSFDATARTNALRDILATLPTTNYDGTAQGFADLLQQLQRRVIAQDLGLDPGSLDILVNNDVLETLGQAGLTKELGYATGAFSGTTTDEITRSIPASYLEQSLRLPPTSLRGDDWNQATERLGRFKVALDNNLDPSSILSGDVNNLKNTPYYAAYKRAEEAYRLPGGVLESIGQNSSEAFRRIGAVLLADTLHYNPDERTTLLDQAKKGTIKQLNLARVGDLKDFPGNALLMIAPGESSSKAAGERYLAKQMIQTKSALTTDSLPSSLRSVLQKNIPALQGTRSRSALTQELTTSTKLRQTLRQAGATYIEQAFELPEKSLSNLVTQTTTPTLEEFRSYVGQRLIEDWEKVAPDSFKATLRLRHTADETDTALSLPSGTTERFLSRQITKEAFQTIVGQAYLDTTFTETFRTFYHVSSVGLAALSLGDMFSVVTGNVNDASTRAGASWVEEDLGLAPDSFSVLFSQATAEERLVNAGIAVLSGELFNAFDVDGTNVVDGKMLKQRIGAAALETTLGLTPGSFRDSIQTVQTKNPDRYKVVFSHPTQVDTGLRLPQGTTQRLIDGALTIADMAEQIGSIPLDRLATENLQDKLGWDNRYKIDGEQLLRTINSSNGQTSKASDGTTVTLRSLLAKIGSYNLDFAFGYAPLTMKAWAEAGSVIAQNQILGEQGGRLYAERMGFGFSDPNDLFTYYRDGDSPSKGGKAGTSKKQSLSDKIRERLKLTNETIPEQDIQSFLSGDMRLAAATIAAVNQANQVKVKFDHGYQLFRTLAIGWSSDPQFEIKLTDQQKSRYSKILQDYAQTHLDDQIDRTLENITKGVLKSDGTIDLSQSPYNSDILTKVTSGYFATKEARNTYFYGLLDEQMKKKDPNLPSDFSKTLMEGSNDERSAMLYTYLKTKVDDTVLNQLPAELRPLASSWFDHFDPATGKILNQDAIFSDWASATLSQYTDTLIAPGAFKIGLNYLNGTIDLAALEKDPTALIDLSPVNLTGLLNKQLGLPTGQYTELYNKYKSLQRIYDSYKTGNLDTAEAVFAVDAILFDGKLAELTRQLDDLLGLPPGSAQNLIQFAISGNPIYLAKFIFTLFFATTIVCPDLQVEAQKNVKLLISKLLEQGSDSAALIPSQIITFNQSYIADLADKINQNYGICLTVTDARCGVFARPEYANQVHIGF